MRGSVFIFLFALVSSAKAVADNVNTFSVHTNDAERFKDLNIKSFVDYAKSDDGKKLSADGTGLTIAGIYHHRSQQDLSNAAPFLDLYQDDASNQVLPPNGTVDRLTNPLTCENEWCLINRQAQYSFKAGIVTLFNYACGWFTGNLGDDWKTSGATLTLWFNNVMCDNGVICSMWVGGTVANPPPTSQTIANIFLSNCVNVMMDIFNGCAAANMGGSKLCWVPQANPSPSYQGDFIYWFRGLPGADWGIPCKNQIGWASLKCGHMTCDATAMQCHWP